MAPCTRPRSGDGPFFLFFPSGELGSGSLRFAVWFGKGTYLRAAADSRSRTPEHLLASASRRQQSRLGRLIGIPSGGPCRRNGSLSPPPRQAGSGSRARGVSSSPAGELRGLCSCTRRQTADGRRAATGSGGRFREKLREKLFVSDVVLTKKPKPVVISRDSSDLMPEFVFPCLFCGLALQYHGMCLGSLAGQVGSCRSEGAVTPLAVVIFSPECHRPARSRPRDEAPGGSC